MQRTAWLVVPVTLVLSGSTGCSGRSTNPIGLCRSDRLTASVGLRTAIPNTQYQYSFEVALILKNSGTKACTVDGFPTVSLIGPADPNGAAYELPRTSAVASLVTLQPGGSAHSVLTYLTDDPRSVGSLGSRNWTPTTIAVTPPGNMSALHVPWTLGDTVVRQDSATHPGTFVGPLLPGSSSP